MTAVRIAYTITILLCVPNTAFCQKPPKTEQQTSSKKKEEKTKSTGALELLREQFIGAFAHFNGDNAKRAEHKEDISKLRKPAGQTLRLQTAEELLEKSIRHRHITSSPNDEVVVLKSSEDKKRVESTTLERSEETKRESHEKFILVSESGQEFSISSSELMGIAHLAPTIGDLLEDIKDYLSEFLNEEGIPTIPLAHVGSLDLTLLFEILHGRDDLETEVAKLSREQIEGLADSASFLQSSALSSLVQAALEYQKTLSSYGKSDLYRESMERGPAGVREFYAEQIQKLGAGGIYFKEVKLQKVLGYDLGLNNENIQSFLTAQTTPLEIKSILTWYLGSRYGYKLCDCGFSIPVTMSPSIRFLKELAAYYATKYEIDLSVMYTLELSQYLRKARKATNPSGNPSAQEVVGVIVANLDACKTHVTPLIFDPTDPALQALILDVLGSGSLEPCPTVQNSLKAEKIVFKVGSKPRQVDSKSCRTDALCVLRNALLLIKWQKSQGTYKGLAHLEESSLEKNPDCSLFNLPPEIDYHSQITNPAIKGGSDAVLIKDYWSSKPYRKEHPRSVGLWRDSHQIQLETMFSLFFLNGLPPEIIAMLNGLVERGEMPEHILFAIDKNGHPRISWRVLKRVNTYLWEKALSNAKKLKDAKCEEQAEY